MTGEANTSTGRRQVGADGPLTPGNAPVPIAGSDELGTTLHRSGCRDDPSHLHVWEVMVSRRRPSREPSRRLPIGIGILLGAALLVACSSSDGAAPATSASGSAPTTSAVNAVTQQVENGYRAFWDAYLQSADPMNPTNPALEAHATGDELHQVQAAFADHFAKGEVIRGRLDLSPHVGAVNGTTATVTDCYGDSTHVFDAATGQQKDEPGDNHFQITASLILDGDTWKVTSIEKQGEGCTPS